MFIAKTLHFTYLDAFIVGKDAMKFAYKSLPSGVFI